MQSFHSQTKIVATIGPASSSKEVLREMFLAGLSVCRLNFSHGQYEDHKKVVQNILDLNEELNMHTAMLVDLQGPKLRIGEVENNAVELIDGAEIEFVNTPCMGTAKKVYMSYQLFPQDVSEGENILIDDGKLKIRVIKTNKKDRVTGKVINGGILSSKKGVNLPDTKISLPCLTDKDKEDLQFALEQNVDWIGLSFVRSATDIMELKDIIKKNKKHARVVAKIEKPEAITDIDDIIDITDAIMVARGDLGVEIPYEQVPLVQKMLVKKCNEKAKPVIIATQMLESMITNFRPTRAEVTDVSNAVLDGADAVMLSAETSVGKYPVDVIKAMQQIIDYSEKYGFVFYKDYTLKDQSHSYFPDSICHAACDLAKRIEARSIITFTHTGHTTIRISSYRPKTNIFAFSTNKYLLRQLSLVWGVRAFYFDHFETIDESIEISLQILKRQQLINECEYVVHVASTPFNENNRTNMIKLTYV